MWNWFIYLPTIDVIAIYNVTDSYNRNRNDIKIFQLYNVTDSYNGNRNFSKLPLSTLAYSARHCYEVNFTFSLTGEARDDTSPKSATPEKQGIGRGIAIKLAECGAKVIAISRTQADLDSLKQQISSVETHALDLSDWNKTRALVQSLGPIDLLVNIAGIAKVTQFLNATKEELDLQFDTNYMTAFNITQVIAKGMVERGNGGAVVMVSSIASYRAADGHAVYCSTKGAMDQLARSLAVELGPHKIRVNCINPGVTKTDLAMNQAGWSKPEWAKPVLDKTPLHRFAEVEEVVNACLFLLSDKASMINGIMMSVDGGITASV